MTLAIIARCDNTGLGNQTLELVKMLEPDLVVLIDSSPFKLIEQYPERYKKFRVVHNHGFISDRTAEELTKNFDMVLSCETFYNDNFIKIAKKNKCKTILQYNYELFPALNKRPFEFPDVLISPSLWNFDQVKAIVRGRSHIVHLPPPTSENLFSKALKDNQGKEHGRLLHVHGTGAAFDRNGTEALISAMRYSEEDFQLVIKTQVPIKKEISDPRIIVELDNVQDSQSIYTGFDGLILPRRYGGLCLPMNEGLLSGLPVFMTNVDPNNKILPREWLFGVEGMHPVDTKVRVNSYRPHAMNMAKKIDRYVNSNKEGTKSRAYDIGYKNFSPQVLKNKYLELFDSI